MSINPNCSKYEYLLKRNERYMDYTALSFADRKITYEELHDRIGKYARILYQKGVRQGDRIGVCILNTPESIYLLYALDALGAEVVGLSPFDNKIRLKQDIELTRPKMIISVDMNYSNFKEYEKALNFSTILYSPVESVDDFKVKLGYKLMQLVKGNFKLSPQANLRSLLKGDKGIVFEKAPYIEGEITDIMFTGGTTGGHKGVKLRGSGLNYVAQGMGKMFRVEPGMVHLGNIPGGHMSFGRMIVHTALTNNMELALTLKAMPEDFYDELVRTGAHAAVGGPPHWTSLIERSGSEFVPSGRLKSGSLSNLLYATSGGEAQNAITVPAINEALELCGSSAKLGDGLACTENWAAPIINGVPVDCLEVELRDPKTNEIVKDGETGILHVSGPSVMLGYLNNPILTAEVISCKDGKTWFNMKDCLRQNPDTGKLEYVGRQKREFVSGVDNVYSEQLEQELIKLAEIREVVVTPISDPIKQNIPRYHISLYDEKLDIAAFERKLRTFVEARFNQNWLPGFIEYYYEPLKRMGNSKIDIGYYRDKDKEDIENGTLNAEKVFVKK